MARGKGGARGNDGVRPRTTRKQGRPVCFRTGKIRYRDAHDAALALRSLARKRSRANLDGGSHNINVKRKYECPTCGGWHLTGWVDAASARAA